MEDDSEPPNRQQENSNLVNIIEDQKHLLLLPSKNEKGVCNPATIDGHFLYRSRLNATNGYKEKSVTKYRKLLQPNKLSSETRTIIVPEFEYEKDGIEDARLSKLNGHYTITYIGYNEDKKNGGTSICLATTEDFKQIHKIGIIGPRIQYKEAIKLVGGTDSYYGKKLTKEINGIQYRHGDIDPAVMVKDATIIRDPVTSEFIQIYRVDPAIQIARTKNLEDFQDENFWKHQFQNLEKNTLLYPGTKDGSWASEKVGLGGTPRYINGKLLCHIHGVEKEEEKKKTKYIYKGTFAELDPKTYQIISILRNPLLYPGGEYIFHEISEEHEVEKYVNFPTEMLIDKNNPDILWNYSGNGDQVIEARSTYFPWLIYELQHPHNQIQNWQFKQ